MTQLPPLLLTGGPAVGKSVTAALLAETTPRTACVDVDDIRQLVRNGDAAPWEGAEGKAQQMLGVANAATITHNFLTAGFNVTLADVVDSQSLAAYRRLIPEVLIVRLLVSLEEARRRARQREMYLTGVEFEALHAKQSVPLAVDHQLEVTHLSLQEQSERVRALWVRR